MHKWRMTASNVYTLFCKRYQHKICQHVRPMWASALWDVQKCGILIQIKQRKKIFNCERAVQQTTMSVCHKSWNSSVKS